MIRIDVNERSVEAHQGEPLLAALRRAGVSVPTLCHMEGLSPTGACRMCVVELEGRPGLVPSCAWPVAEGMQVRTHSPRAVQARRSIVELLLASHPDDCLYCVRNGSCTLQSLAAELGVRSRRYRTTPRQHKQDLSSPAIVRDPAKCVLCGKCVRVCDEVQGVGCIDLVGRGADSVVATALHQGINLSSCVCCGQCVMVCPTGALSERSHLPEVQAALADPRKHVVVQHAPSVSVTLGEELGVRPGADVDGLMTAALRKLGFARVFDTSFAADLTIMEEASELAERVRSGGPLPMITSCSPGWIKFLEQRYPDLIPNVSTCKSPQQMMGAIIKSFYAERAGVDPATIYSVAVMPCTAKKFESRRPELAVNGLSDVDAVLTTRELAQLVRQGGLDFGRLKAEAADTPFGERSSAGKLFGASGGVMEAALRTASHLLTGQPLPELKVDALRGSSARKEAKVHLGELEVGVAAVSGLSNAATLLDELRAGRSDLHFVEVMTCPGGCVAGGGQPIGADPAAIKARMAALYTIDRDAGLRCSHDNPSVKRLYREYLGEPGGERSHTLLHTRYAPREVLI